MLAMASLGRITSVINEPLEAPDLPYKVEDKAHNGVIEFEDVSFGYDSNNILMKHLNLKIKAKSKVAIVGPTGAGKSTIINLLLRFYNLQGGKIYLDGKDITSISKQALRESFGLILQDTWLFSGTIRDNIKYGKKDATDEEMIKACKDADCHDFIMSLQDGYDTLVDETGGISKGQKQLLTIARALLLKPCCLILDEATSNIDSLTEEDIQHTFNKIMKEHTSLYIAHHLATITDADLILVVDHGNIVEWGTHESLLANASGTYYQIYMSQNV
jgi:ABC-type multidrug transport system fused ATPase/permease subunit